MPIEKVPIVHKFGIISQSQRIELEERIAKKALSDNERRLSSQRSPARPLPFEVTEDFVFKFNDSGQGDKEKLEDIAMKMLERLKRLAGLRQAGEAYHSDLGRAWVDLALLAQCRSSTLEEACLDILLASLDQAFISEENVLSLFYLAKSGIHWLKRDTFTQTVLRSGEIKLLKMTFLVFVRLYCHHILGQLKGYEDQQASLAQYLKGFSEKGECYNQFPGGYRSVQFIIESGYIICNSTQKIANEEFTFKDTITGDSLQKEQPDKHTVELNKGPADYFIQTNKDGSTTGTFLWHSLNVWYAVNYEQSRLNSALYSLFQNVSYLAQESWVNILVIFYILSDASSQSLPVLEAFQYLIGLKLKPVSKAVEPVPICQSCYSNFSNNRGKKSCNSNNLHESTSKLISPDEPGSNSSPNVLEKLQAFVQLGRSSVAENIVLNESVQEAEIETSPKCDDKEHVRPINDLCEEQTYRMMSQMTSQRPNYRWPWPLLYTFCECMTNICLRGSSSAIRRVALLGESENGQSYNKKVQRSCGLVDFLQYRKDDENDDGFRVRYGAVQGLVHIYRHCHGDNTKEGVTNVAWSSLVYCQSIEKDPRVLDAIKVGKVEADLQNKLTTEHIPVSLLSSRLATTLSQVSHASQPPVTRQSRVSPTTITCTTRSSKRRVPKPEKSQPAFPIKPSLRQEINLSNALQKSPVSYNTKASLELRAVIEDQWKKELHQETERELETNVNELTTMRTEELNKENVT